VPTIHCDFVLFGPDPTNQFNQRMAFIDQLHSHCESDEKGKSSSEKGWQRNNCNTCPPQSSI
jgi:hypothetical protein